MFRHILRLLRWAWMLPLAAAVLIDLDSLASTGEAARYRGPVMGVWLLGVVAATVAVQVTLSSPRPLFDRSRSGLPNPLTPVTLTVIGVAAVLPRLLDGATTPTVSALYAGLVLTGVLASRSLAVADLVMMGIAGILVVLPFALQGPSGDPALVSVTVTAAVISAALGLLIREQHRRVAIAREAAVQGERMTMARELHDSVAHELTGILVLARASLRPAPATGDPENDTVQQALGLIVESSQRALEEIRDLVRTIEPPGPAAQAGSTGPSDADRPAGSSGDSHGHRRLVSLVETFDAGTTATVDADIEDLRLTPSEWLTLQRVCAEALTNVRRHAASAERIVVRLRHVDGMARLEVTDDGKGVGGLGGGSGTGIRGARRRIEALGGQLRAGPTGDGRWSLVAEFPSSRRDIGSGGVPTRRDG